MRLGANLARLGLTLPLAARIGTAIEYRDLLDLRFQYHVFLPAFVSGLESFACRRGAGVGKG